MRAAVGRRDTSYRVTLLASVTVVGSRRWRRSLSAISRIYGYRHTTYHHGLFVVTGHGGYVLHTGQWPRHWRHGTIRAKSVLLPCHIRTLFEIRSRRHVVVWSRARHADVGFGTCHIDYWSPSRWLLRDKVVNKIGLRRASFVVVGRDNIGPATMRQQAPRVTRATPAMTYAIGIVLRLFMNGKRHWRTNGTTRSTLSAHWSYG